MEFGPRTGMKVILVIFYKGTYRTNAGTIVQTYQRTVFLKPYNKHCIHLNVFHFLRVHQLQNILSGIQPFTANGGHPPSLSKVADTVHCLIEVHQVVSQTILMNYVCEL